MDNNISSVLHRWPTLLGLAAAGINLATGATRELPAIVVAVAAVCYLGAAALDRPWIAWAGILGGSVVITVGEFVGVPWWAGLGVTSLVLIIIGLITQAPRQPLLAQAAALVGFGGVAVLSLALAPTAGLVLAGAVLAGHAVWDVIHYRRDVTVPRSLAEFCMFLDVPLGVGCIIVALTG